MPKQNDVTRAQAMKKILFSKQIVTVYDIMRQFGVSYTRALYTMKALRELLDEEGVQYTYDSGVLWLESKPEAGTDGEKIAKEKINDVEKAKVMLKVLKGKREIDVYDIMLQFEIPYTRAITIMRLIAKMLDREGVPYDYRRGTLTLKSAAPTEAVEKTAEAEEEAVDEEEKIREEVEKILNAQPANE